MVVAGAGTDTTDDEVLSPLPGLHLDVRAREILDAEGVVRGRALLLSDVSTVVERRLAAERASAQLADEAACDPLTALYEAEEAGRDRVVLAQPELDHPALG